jgi:hypothetical protein
MKRKGASLRHLYKESKDRLLRRQKALLDSFLATLTDISSQIDTQQSNNTSN